MKKSRVRVVWEFDYEPKTSEYPNIDMTAIDCAQVDKECGLFSTLMEKGKGRFRIEEANSCSRKRMTA